MSGIRQSDQAIRIVDPDRNEYDGLSTELQADAFKLLFFCDARTALRYGGHQNTVMWIVGIELPDMPGIALVELLRGQSRRTPICVVGRRYEAAHEQSALQKGATLYATKPLDVEKFVSLARHISTAERIELPLQAAPTRGSPESGCRSSQHAVRTYLGPLTTSKPSESVRGGLRPP